MENLIIKKQTKSPGILFDTNGDLKLFGRSIPENSIEFYAPAKQWLKDFSETCPRKIKMEVKLEYFNTSSSKCILELFKQIENLYKNGCDVNVVWIYEEDDEDIQEAGEDYQSIVRVPFRLKEVIY